MEKMKNEKKNDDLKVNVSICFFYCGLSKCSAYGGRGGGVLKRCVGWKKREADTE